MRGLGNIQNILLSDTKPTFGICSHLTADKLFPVNSRAFTGPPKMNLLLEVKTMPELVVKPRLILVAHTDDLGWNITSNQQQQMLVQDFNRIVGRPNTTPGQILYCTPNCISIDLMFKENFPSNTQVWKSMSHRNDCRQRRVIRVTYGCCNSNP